MHRQVQFRLIFLTTALAALAALTGLRAGDPVKQSSGKADTAKIDGSLAPPVKPKPLINSVEKGLAYLVNQQHESGGWSQGGGWRNSAQSGGRIEGANV